MHALSGLLLAQKSTLLTTHNLKAKIPMINSFTKIAGTFIILAITILALCLPVHAQVTAQIGTENLTPNNTLYGPLYRYSATSTTSGARVNMLWTATEMSAAGIPNGALITGVEFNKTSVNNFNSDIPLFEMYVANSNNSALSTTDTWTGVLSTHTMVLSSTSYNVPSVAGWVAFPFNTPFTYTGGSFEVATTHTKGTTGSTGNIPWEYSSGNSDKIVGVANATGTTLSGTVSSYKERPNIKITYILPTGCSGTPTAGTAQVMPNPVCPNADFTLSLDGTPAESGITYQWQISGDGITYTDIPGANASFLTTSQTASNYYQAIVTCTNSGLSSTSSPVHVISPSLISGTFTINQNAATGVGNFASFADAINYLSCGINGPVTFNVVTGSGPYNEQVVIPQILGASSLNTVTFNGNGETLTFAGNSSARSTITLEGASFVTINNLIVNATDVLYGWGIHLYNDANNNTISNNTVNISSTSTSSSNSVGIILNGSTTSYLTGDDEVIDNIIDGNIVNGGYTGIVVSGSASGMTGNVVSNNTVVDFYSQGIWAEETSGIEIFNNEIYRAILANTTTTYMLALDGDNVGAKVYNNILRDPYAADVTNSSTVYGIYNGSNNTTLGNVSNTNYVYNNLIYSFKSGGTQYGIYSTFDELLNVYHNTVVLDEQNTSATTSNTYGFYQSSDDTEPVEVKNNIFYLTRSGASYTGDVTGIKVDVALLYMVADNNVYYVASTTGTNYIGSTSTSGGYTTLADWRTATLLDMLSSSSDPEFALVAPDEYMPTSSSINNMGAAVPVNFDINGTSRDPLSPDPGAYEYTPVGKDAIISWMSPVNPVTAGSHPVTININNAQTATINSVSVTYTDGAIFETEVFTGLGLTSGNNVNLTFATPYTLVSSADLRAYINTVNGSADNDQTNDTTVTVTICTAMAGNYTINSGTPTSGTNFNNFNDAVTKLITCGISGPVVFDVVVGSGPYNEQFALPEIIGGSATNTITFNGNGETITFSSNDGNNRAVIRLEGADYVTIDNFVIDATGSGTYGWGIHLMNASDNASITNNTVITDVTSSNSVNYIGIAASNSLTSATSSGNNTNNTIISNNSITGGYYGIRLNGTSASSLASGNQILNNNVVDAYYYGIYSLSQDLPVIRGNNISMRAGNTSSYGIYISSNENGFELTNNTITNLGSYGIYITSSNDATGAGRSLVANNMIGGGVQGTGTEYGIYITSSDNLDIWHNSINMDGGSARGLYALSSATGLDIRNNSFAYTAGGTGYAMYIASTSSILNSDYNNYYSNGSNFVYYGGAKADLAALQATNVPAGNDVNSHTGDPLYTSATDLHAYGPQLNGKATPLTGITTDIDGDLRDLATPDIGADEYTPLPVDITLLSVVTPPNSGCFGTTEPVTIQIGNIGLNNIDFSVTPAVFNILISGSSAQTISYTLNTGTLTSLGTMNISVGTIDLTASGIHTLSATVTLPGDGNLTNNEITGFDINSSGTWPAITSTTDETRCGVGTVNLSATGDAGSTINWYDAAVGGTHLGTGNNFTTPIISTSTGYYVSATSSGGTQPVGAFDNTIGSISSYGTDFYYMEFDVISPTTIISIDIYPTATVGSSSSIEIKDNSGLVLYNIPYTTTVTGGNVQTVQLNVSIPAGNGYRMYQGSNFIDLNRNTTGASYPYTNAGISITGNNFSTSYYYWFYNWQIATGCESPRVLVTATVVPADEIVASASQHTICGGNETVTLTAGSTNANYSYTWQPGGQTGATINISPLETTTYIVHGYDPVSLCENYDTLTIDVVPSPVVTLTNTGTFFCDQANSVLSAGSGGAPTVQIGTGASDSYLYGPLYISTATSSYRYSRHTAIYTAAEIAGAGGAGGLINTISWNKADADGYTGNDGEFSIYIKTVSSTGFSTSSIDWATEIAGATLVYSSTTQNLNTSTGWQDFILNNPFTWNGVDNIQVFVDWYRPSTSVTGSYVDWYYTSTSSTGDYRSADNDGTSIQTTVSSTYNRPDVQFGFSQSLSYSWSPAIGLNKTTGPTVTTTANATTTYSVVVTDNLTGCTATDSVTIVVGETPTPIISSTQSMPLCEGSSTTLSTQYLAANGYTFSWNGGLFTSENITVNLPGVYECIVTSPEGCTSTAATFTIEIATIFADVAGTTPVLCNGDSTGTVTIDALGTLYDPSGNVTFGPFVYAANGGAYQSSSIITGLWAGTHNVTVYDSASACAVNISVIITEPSPLVAGPVIINQNVSCNGLSNGSATATASGGTGPYTYSWNTPIPKQGELNDEIPAGTWTVAVTDDNGCTATVEVTITEPDPMVASVVSQTQVSCNGLSDASVTITATGGTTPYAGDGAHSGLAAGTHEFIVSDANGCTDTVTVTITQPIEVTVSATSTNVSCNGQADGTITVNAPQGATVTIDGQAPAATYGPGTYNVVASVSDGNGVGTCSASTTVTITEPGVVTVSAASTDVICNGFANGTISATASQGASITVDGQPYDANTQYGPGTYTVMATAANGNNDGACTATTTVIITEPGLLANNFTINHATYWNAYNGSVTASAYGGTAPYSYVWNTGATTATIGSLHAGSYTVTITDGNGCILTETAIVNEPGYDCVDGTQTHFIQGPGGWGGQPSGNNPATYLYANFASAFPNGLSIGYPTGMNGPCNRSITLTTEQAITNFLPSAGMPNQLNAGHQVNITASQYGNILASMTVALTLHVVFDTMDVNFSPSTVAFGEMVYIGGGAYNGMTVYQILNAANNILACGGKKNEISQLNTVIDYILHKGNVLGCPSNPVVRNVTPGFIPVVEDEIKINIYPNPTSGIVTVSFASTEVNPNTIIIMDLQGRIVMEMINESGSIFNKEINMSHLENGLYIINFINENGIIKSSRISKVD